MTYEHNENSKKVKVVILKINYGTKIQQQIIFGGI